MTARSPTPEESFYFQSAALAESIVALSNMEQNGFTEVPALPSLLNGNFLKTMRDQHGTPVFGGQGALLACIYLLAVLPLEWAEPRGKEGHEHLKKIDFSKARDIAHRVAQNSRRSGYCSDSCVLRHLRNSIAHGRVDFEEVGKFIFKDEYNGKTFRAEITMEGVGELVQALYNAAHEYFISQFGQVTNS